LRLAGILFPHINDDARSKSHQICNCSLTTGIFPERCKFATVRPIYKKKKENKSL